jgi:hypothetical protein
MQQCRGRSSGNRSSARVGSGTRSHAGGGSGEAAAPSSASTLRRFLPTPAGRAPCGEAPSGPLAHKPGAVQDDPDRLDPRPIASHLGQIVGQQPTRPQRTVHANRARVLVGDPDQLGLPPRRVVRWLARVGTVRDRVRPAAKVAVKDAAHGVGAATGPAGQSGWGCGPAR